ncbi:hypothetical protein [Phreatobacter oligotrophus]|uniref:hypothetical protein n=1 Tax=Phreatobacter oligotrophus TaxID=1122261 RepID=UPI0011B259CB|nr:hypothetical protein [Phreatobacter oligotrophus]
MSLRTIVVVLMVSLSFAVANACGLVTQETASIRRPLDQISEMIPPISVSEGAAFRRAWASASSTEKRRLIENPLFGVWSIHDSVDSIRKSLGVIEAERRGPVQTEEVIEVVAAVVTLNSTISIWINADPKLPHYPTTEVTERILRAQQAAQDAALSAAKCILRHE